MGGEVGEVVGGVGEVGGAVGPVKMVEFVVVLLV